MARLSGITVIVTGAEQLLAQAVVRRLVAEGASVVAAHGSAEPDLDRDAVAGAARSATLDVTSRRSWDDLLASVRAHEGALHGLVNAAASIDRGPLAEMSEDVLARTLAVNLLGPTIGVAAAAPVLAQTGGGSIVNVAPTEAQRGTPEAAAAAAASWGLRGLTRSAALEFGSAGIRVNTVCAPLHLVDDAVEAADDAPTGRLEDQGKQRSVTIGDVASMVAFLLSDDSATCTGGDYLVDGGASA